MKGRSEYLFHDPIILQKRRQATIQEKRRRGAPQISVRTRPGNPTEGILEIEGKTFSCALGRTGTSAFKREGDGATPIGVMRPLLAYYRGDRKPAGMARTPLPKRAIGPGLGWCDDPRDANYNRPVRLPYPASHEAMLRKDLLYDACIVLDWNMRPRRLGRGSAIFLHLAAQGMKPTDGCIAVGPRTMARLLPLLERGTRIRVWR
ncbi:L,D-transpeptidase family protein [Chelativorans sp. M5D2P16]|uniref:L,D-transpeptidase family protein n=1 Tax=Chelativorans sp. M5D2P16 TaxID=3095678 RepID=UPI002ACA5A9C|nr:L,D-transpeptidase family protein [Chelativorans sp. M5D2P16]MDZ5699346.1 L,D-transpeptidase family protein [Chelativorans sp. M5D2P16]